MGSFIQIIGAVLVLAGFVLAQRGVLTHTSTAYLVLNLIGSTILAGDALLQRQWGFLLLESVWAVVSAAGLAVALHLGASAPTPITGSTAKKPTNLRAPDRDTACEAPPTRR